MSSLNSNVEGGHPWGEKETREKTYSRYYLKVSLSDGIIFINFF